MKRSSNCLRICLSSLAFQPQNWANYITWAIQWVACHIIVGDGNYCATLKLDILFERRQQQCQNLHVMVTSAYIIYYNCWAWAICHLSTSLCDELPQTCAKTNRFITLLSVLIWLIFSNLDRSVLCVFLYNFVCMMCDCLIQPCGCQISINDWLIDWLTEIIVHYYKMLH